MQIDRIEELRLTPSDEAGIAGLLAASFDTEFGGRSYFIQRPHLRLVARSPDRITGHLGLTFRSIRAGDRLIPILGLGDVATDPLYRGQGIATALLRAAIDEARQTPAEFLVLFGDAGLYAAHGFAPRHNPLRHVEMTGARTGAVGEAVKDSLMVLPLRDTDWPEGPLDFLGHLF
jgi:predicted N-acetyltransferase YhbS